MPPPLRRAAGLGVTARAMTDQDLEFSAALYASTRARELAQADWPEEQRRTFLAQQHAAQHHHYRTYYGGAEWLILEQGGTAIGRLYLADWRDEFRIIDVSLVPGSRGTGIGEAILRDVQEAARAAGKRVSIHVEKTNPARRLYERLGFAITQDKGVYDLMEWPIASPTS